MNNPYPMEQDIIDIITLTDAKRLSKMSEAKATSYMKTVYVGLRVDVDGCVANAVASEIGYNNTSAYKLMSRWKEMVEAGDPSVKALVAAYRKYIKGGRKPVIERPAKTISDEERVRRAFGFDFTDKDRANMRAAVRESIRFMEKYGKGVNPRMHGEYYSPGTSPDAEEAKKQWIHQEQATLYCGCSLDILNKAAQQEEIQRRLYKRSGSRNFYEFLVNDLDKFIVKNHLL